MKFIRNGRIRDKVIDFISKALLLALSALFCLWMISGAKAAQIMDISQSSSPEGAFIVDLKFSESIAKENVAVEFQRNFIQVSVKGLAAFPAKTKVLNHPLLDKAFTYQYQPDLARIRILLKTTAAKVEKKTNWEMTEKGFRLSINAPATSTLAEKESKTTAGDSLKTTSSSVGEKSVDADDDLIVKKIIQSSKENNKAAADSVPTTPEQAAITKNTEELPVFGHSASSLVPETKAKTSPMTKVFAALLMILGVIGAGALAFRRFMQGKSGKFLRQTKMIETISTHSMGPKKSIAIVKVIDQYMVIGISGESMNLLTNLGSGINIEKQIDDFGPGLSFSNAFQGAIQNEVTPQVVIQKNTKSSGIRDLIKKRIEGFKPL